MKIFQSTLELLQWRNESENKSIGFVPTMGALHEGHASLLKIARSESDLVVISILINPTQFGDPSDFKNYPQTLEEDLQIAQTTGVDVVFVPTPEDLYGGKPQADKVDWGSVTSDFEAAYRPGHFDGVVAVVDRLFTAVKPHIGFFGEKDLQQVAVIKKLAKDRHPQIHIRTCPLIRDEEGLALSSRNTRLSEEGKQSALSLSQSLSRIKSSVNTKAQIEKEREVLKDNIDVEIEYLEGVNEVSYSKKDSPESWTHVIIAAEVEGVRLIDNIRL